jgi:hypothetical protein
MACLHIGFTSGRAVPLLFSTRLALIGPLNRDAQQPFCYASVGFCLDATEAILLTTTLHISGLNDAACLLAHSSFVRPLLGWHAEFTPDLLARR